MIRFPGWVRLNMVPGLKNKLWIRINKVREILWSGALSILSAKWRAVHKEKRLPISIIDHFWLQLGRGFIPAFGKERPGFLLFTHPPLSRLSLLLLTLSWATCSPHVTEDTVSVKNEELKAPWEEVLVRKERGDAFAWGHWQLVRLCIQTDLSSNSFSATWQGTWPWVSYITLCKMSEPIPKS